MSPGPPRSTLSDSSGPRNSLLCPRHSSFVGGFGDRDRVRTLRRLSVVPLKGWRVLWSYVNRVHPRLSRRTESVHSESTRFPLPGPSSPCRPREGCVSALEWGRPASTVTSSPPVVLQSFERPPYPVPSSKCVRSVSSKITFGVVSVRGWGPSPWRPHLLEQGVRSSLVGEVRALEGRRSMSGTVTRDPTPHESWTGTGEPRLPWVSDKSVGPRGEGDDPSPGSLPSLVPRLTP